MTQLPQPLQSPTHTPPTQHQTHKPHPHLLAQETWLQILHHLDFRSLARLSQTSHSFATLCLDPSLWKHLCLLNRVTLITDDDQTDTTNDTQDQSVEDVFSLSGLLLDNSEIETLSGAGAGTTEVSSGIKKTDWKRQFIMHRKRVLERMRKSRAYWYVVHRQSTIFFRCNLI
ncbi:hypothetical protein BCR33DRAFT_367204 [Rhizoclosmatium globosum]|uniref:F-box domain-containing protein n=1 Tax=Rhizoclosmatium globosum TaxID=329046 RepID=A0A1Y2C0D9_9FUNG|nr:hypothetical protein BCR33DRAFT_367204 [Rhizoclosmatium globosum]|eukprot:ORY40502.1 hypothetical protein BCR33DRAFT_367204 [Rhizoclosmatium globosum]